MRTGRRRDERASQPPPHRSRPCSECRGTGWTGIDGEFPCDPCGGSGRVPDIPIRAYADTNGVPPRDEWAGELEQARDDAAVDVAEALDEAREAGECGGVEPWRSESPS